MSELSNGLQFQEGERDLETNNVTRGFYNEEKGLYTRYEFERVGEALRLFASGTYNPETDHLTYVSYHEDRVFRVEGNSREAKWTHLRANEGETKGYTVVEETWLTQRDRSYFIEFVYTGNV